MPTLSFDVLWRDRGAERGMKQLGDTTEKTSHRFRGLKVMGAAALAAVGVAAVKFGSDSVKAYVEAEGSQLRLQDAFRKFPKLADTNIGSLNRLNSALAMKTRFDDDATSSGQAVLAQFNLTGKQITQLTPLLQDYAAKTGKDLPTAAKELGKAVMGNGKALKNVGVDFKDTGTQSGNLTQIMGGLRSQVGGFAEKEGKSAAGQAEILKNQFGELQESAGQQLLPALLKVGNGLLRFVGFIGDLSPVFGSFKRIAAATFGSISESLGLGHASFKNFADFVMTHQGDIVEGFVSAGKAALAIGRGILSAATVGLRGFAMLMDAQTNLTAISLAQFGKIVQGAALAFGWIPGIGTKLKVAQVQFGVFAATAVNGMRGAAHGARVAADGIDNKLNPALDRAGHKLDEVSRKEIVKARMRDAVEKTRVAVAALGDTTDGSQLKLKRFADRSRLSADEQAALRTRLRNASAALQSQISVMRDAGAGQDKLSRAWKIGKDRLYDEFRQMGLSRAEAKRLAAQYAGVKPKVTTKFETPGLPAARKGTKGLDDDINGLNSKGVNVRVNYSSQGRISLQRQATGRGIPKAAGGVLPGWSPGRDIHTFTSPTGGKLFLSGGEAVMRPEFTRAVGGEAGVARLNAAAIAGKIPGAAHGPTSQAFASGGVVGLPTSHSWKTASPDERAHVRHAWLKQYGSFNNGPVEDMKTSYRNRFHERDKAERFARAGGDVVPHAGFFYAFADPDKARAHALRKRERANAPVHTMASGGVFNTVTERVSADRPPNVRAAYASAVNYAEDYATRLARAEASRLARAEIARQRAAIRAAAAARRAAASLGGGGGKKMSGSIISIARSFHPSYIAGHRDPQGGPAYDIGSSGAKNNAIANALRVNHARLGLRYVISQMRIASARSGWGWRRYSPITNAGDFRHVGHVHVSYDKGGILRSGGIGVNRSGQPERVLSPRQTASFDRMVRVMDRGGSAGGTTVIINAPHYIGSQEDLKRALVDLNRRGQLQVIKR